jgi:hypothetical protein
VVFLVSGVAYDSLARRVPEDWRIPATGCHLPDAH